MDIRYDEVQVQAHPVKSVVLVVRTDEEFRRRLDDAAEKAGTGRAQFIRGAIESVLRAIERRESAHAS